MKKKHPPRAKKLTPTPKGREALQRVMERALARAAEGGCSGWSDVLSKLSEADQAALRLWAGAKEKDAIEIACGKARAPIEERLGRRRRR